MQMAETPQKDKPTREARLITPSISRPKYRDLPTGSKIWTRHKTKEEKQRKKMVDDVAAM